MARCFSPLVLVFALVAAVTARPAFASDRLTVVELFTSQGCSSCPPADALLAGLAATPGVLPLSEHVDYWDYLGWKDPFALAETRNRQKSYAARLGLPYVYTPQMIVQGQLEVRGADPGRLATAIAAVAALPPLPVAIRPGDGDTLTVSLGAAPLNGPVDLWLAVFEPERRIRIGAGENSGRHLIYVNVVRAFHHLGTWQGDARDLVVPRPDIDAVAADAAGRGRAGPGPAVAVGETAGGWDCAVLVQEPNAGPILAAARMTPR